VSDLLLELLPWSLAGPVRDQKLYVVTLGLLVLGSLLALLALRVERLDVLAVAVAGGGAVGWLLSSAPAEGATLIVVQPGNGLTAADLAAAPAVLLVAVLAGRRLRRS
jgi:hypothetical protein